MAGALLHGGGAASSQSIGYAPETFVAGELESYLRTLQVAGIVPAYPWSLRGFGAAEAAALTPARRHPWSDRPEFSGAALPGFQLHAPRVRTIFNSAFPYGGNDGAIWAGRGLTAAVEAGLTLHRGPLTLTLAPVAFVAQNADFDLVPQTLLPGRPYADWRRPSQIDLPQRFGDGRYAVLDPGQSTLRVDGGGAVVGLSTANQVWGPASEHPLLMGYNAPGFLHLFAGTSRPVNLGVGRLHGRVVWARLDESPFATTHPDSSARFGTGITAVFTPRGLPGLEIGGARFFHLPWTQDGVGFEHLAKPFEAFFKVDLYQVINGDTVEALSSVAANQIASAFARWVFPASGLEVYGELASEDHRHNLRDWIGETDHATAYTLGFRKVWTRESDRMLVLTGEMMNAQASHLGRTRRQEPYYIHSMTRQGHTSRGQLIGSPDAYGGAASIVGLDRYHPGGRWTVAWKRAVRQEWGRYLETGEIVAPDVVHALAAEGVLFRGPWELTGGLEAAHNFNRNFESDATNLNAVLGVRFRL